MVCPQQVWLAPLALGPLQRMQNAEILHKKYKKVQNSVRAEVQVQLYLSPVSYWFFSMKCNLKHTWTHMDKGVRGVVLCNWLFTLDKWFLINIFGGLWQSWVPLWGKYFKLWPQRIGWITCSVHVCCLVVCTKVFCSVCISRGCEVCLHWHLAAGLLLLFIESTLSHW